MADQPLTKADRGNLASLARKRAKVARSMIGERIKVLRSEVEDQLSAEYQFDDEIWAAITVQAQVQVKAADTKIAQICRDLGVPDNLRPSLSLGWHGRGENALASRRTELRRLAHARIDARAESAKVVIEVKLLEVETELIRDGLESAEALAFVEAMPTPEQLLPSVHVGELTPGSSDAETDRFGRYNAWEPPENAVAQLITPSSGTDRKNKRDAITAALAADPDRSDREIARLAGVDHKTVGKLRAVAGEFPRLSGEFPSNEGEGDLPT